MNTNKLEHIDCPICEEDMAEPLFEKASLSVVICKRCRFAVCESEGERQTLAAAYTETYYPPDKVERIRTDNMEWLQMTERLTELAQYRSSGRLLDVGCGIGTFLHLAREQDGNRTGLIRLRVAVRLRRKSISLMYGVQISLRQVFRMRVSMRLHSTTC